MFIQLFNFYWIRFGNAAKAIGYITNGEASDWLLATHGIIALSPELGDENQKSLRFYP